MTYIKNYQEQKIADVYETATHRFKMDQEKLQLMSDAKNFSQTIATKIQKSMKQIVSKCSGDVWEESYRLIYQKIQEDYGSSVQTTLNASDVIAYELPKEFQAAKYCVLDGGVMVVMTLAGDILKMRDKENQDVDLTDFSWEFSWESMPSAEGSEFNWSDLSEKAYSLHLEGLVKDKKSDLVENEISPIKLVTEEMLAKVSIYIDDLGILWWKDETGKISQHVGGSDENPVGQLFHDETFTDEGKEWGPITREDLIEYMRTVVTGDNLPDEPEEETAADDKSTDEQTPTEPEVAEPKQDDVELSPAEDKEPEFPANEDEAKTVEDVVGAKL